MSRQEFKAREKVTQKMSRGGLVERNMATGEDNRISRRDAEFDLRGKASEHESYSQVGNRMPDAKARQRQSYQRQESVIESSADVMQPDSSRVESQRHDPPRQVYNETATAVSPAGSPKPTVTHQSAGSPKPTDRPDILKHHRAEQPVTQDNPRHPASAVDTSNQKRDAVYRYHQETQKTEEYTATHNTPTAETSYTVKQESVAVVSPIESGHPPRNKAAYDAVDDADIIAITASDSEKPADYRRDAHSALRHEPEEPKLWLVQEHETMVGRLVDTEKPDDSTAAVISPASDDASKNLQEPAVSKSTLQHTKDPSLMHKRKNPRGQRKQVQASNKAVMGAVPTKPNAVSQKTLVPDKLQYEPQKPKLNPDFVAVPTADVLHANSQHTAVADKATTTPAQQDKAADKQEQDKKRSSQDQKAPVRTDVAPVPPKATAPAAAAAQPLALMAGAKKAKGSKPESGLKSAKPEKLHFSDGDAVPEKLKNKKLDKANRQLEKTSGKLEKVRAKLPTKRKIRKQRVYDEQKGKAKSKLYFEKEVKPQKEHIKGPVPLRPVKAGANALVVHGHRKLYQVEHENVQLKAAHRAEMVAEGGVRSAFRHHKTAPYRKAAKLEHQAMKKAVNQSYQQALAHNPKQKHNPIQKMWQKRKIKKDYAKKAHEAQKAAKRAKKAVEKTTEKTWQAVKSVARFVRNHPVATIIMLILFVLLLIILSMCSVGGNIGLGGLGSVVSSTYLAEDADMLAAEAAYAGMEAGLQYELDNYATLHPGYDEYRFDLDTIWHDPYVLMSIIGALHEGVWTLADVQGTLVMLFDRQYTLTVTVTVEVRTRMETTSYEDADTGEIVEEEVEVEYNYYICSVTLNNFNLSHLPIYIMGEDNLSRYALYMATHGNRPDLFPAHLYPNASVLQDYGRHDIPQEYLDADPTFAAIIAEAEKWLGMPYVWGGYSPKTSFDCSGFVSWVLNQSGWNIGRLGASGLHSMSSTVPASEARPGDLVFFHSTYDAPNPNGATHVGIYVGDGMMLHCGNPIGYTSIETAYWQSHLLAFGRIY